MYLCIFPSLKKEIQIPVTDNKHIEVHQSIILSWKCDSDI